MAMLFTLSVYLLTKRSTEVVTFTVKRRANGVTLFQSAKVQSIVYFSIYLYIHSEITNCCFTQSTSYSCFSHFPYRSNMHSACHIKWICC